MEEFIDDSKEASFNAATCIAWVPQGRSKAIPYKNVVSSDELKNLIEQAEENLKEFSLFDKDTLDKGNGDIEEDNILDHNEDVIEEIDNEEGEENEEIKEENNETNDVEMKYESKEKQIEEEFKMKTYDTDLEREPEVLSILKSVAEEEKEHPQDPSTDPETKLEEDADHILPSDNLIVVGRNDDDVGILEVHVYNPTESHFYVHHEMLLPSIPLCLEWLSFGLDDKNMQSGNLVAIGSMDPIVRLVNLDIMDYVQEPFCLGQTASKKKKRKAVGHAEAVLSLAWNKELDHILASGSADESAIFWDLHEAKPAQTISVFKGTVNSLKWNPTQNYSLLSGCSDKFCRLFDCRPNECVAKWKFDDEIECLAWENDSIHFYASTEKGTVYRCDSRVPKTPIYHFKAHESSCSALVLNSQLPGCVVTGSQDECVCVWDAAESDASKPPSLVHRFQPDVGMLHAAAAGPDEPFAIGLGGDNVINAFTVWDIRTSEKVREGFFDRLGLPVEDDLDNEALCKLESSKMKEQMQERAETWKPENPTQKKKGGKLERKRKLKK